MRLVTWNVNSIRARLDRALAWLDSRKPDVLCMQELKTDEESFPREPFAERGYHVHATYQKTYNGVAILSRAPMTDLQIGLDDGVDDPQSRLCAATIDGIRVISAYIPNGGVVGTDKWTYKLEWLARLRRHLETRYSPTTSLALCGDFNVAPEARDVHDPKAWEGEVLFHPDARAALANLTSWGLTDSFRLHTQDAGLYSWWDYRMLGFQKNRGLRIDHIFLTAPLVPRCASVTIDREERKGKQPSDHAPVIAELT